MPGSNHWKPQVIGQNNLDEISEKLDRARRYENYIHSLCPFHTDHRPSFFVYEDWYRCLSCQTNGATDTLLSKLQGNTGSIIRDISNFKNPWSRWLKNSTLKDVIIGAWKNGPSVYIRERGIPDNVQKKLGIGLKENWITFPITDRKNRIIGGVARAGEGNNSEAKYVTPYGQSPNLLYIPAVRQQEALGAKQIYLTYGILDAISLFACGHFCAMSTVGGKRLDHTALDEFRKPIVIIPDHGEEREAMQLASKLGWRGRVMNLDYPIGTKDCNDLLRVGQLELAIGG